MKDSPWRRRARECGLTNASLATLTGANAATVSRYFSRESRGDGGLPRYMESLIVVWDHLTAAQKAAVLVELAALPEPVKQRRANVFSKERPAPKKQKTDAPIKSALKSSPENEILIFPAKEN
jgi:hypothetical protein